MKKIFKHLTFSLPIFLAVFFGQLLFVGINLASAEICEASSDICYYVSPDGDDLNSGTADLPFKTIGQGITNLNPGDTLYFRAGEYRMLDQGSTRIYIQGINDENYITIAGYPGEDVILLGSRSTEEFIWEEYGTGIYRISAEFLTNNPTGMFKQISDHINSTRITHASDLVGGRDHNNVSEMDNETWTKADNEGMQCFSSNDGCFIYIKTVENPNDNIYELSQGGSFHSIGTPYTLFDNLKVFYTQSAGLFTEGCDNITIQNSIFGHNSNGNDNAYGLRIWSSGGAKVRNNVVFDSEYWGGYSNSKGITFMVSNPDNPHIVEHNEIYDIPGSAAIGVKGGVSNLVARYNYIHDVALAFDPGSYRCRWSSSNQDGCQQTDVEYRPGGSWKIYGNIIKDSITGLTFPGYHELDCGNNLVYNNVFHNVEIGINIGWDGEFGNVIVNNIFNKNDLAIYLGSGAITTTVEDYLDQFESYNNIFYDNLEDIHLRPNWGGNRYSGTPYTLEEFQTQFIGRENNSISEDPLFVDSSSISLTGFKLQNISPALTLGIDRQDYDNDGDTIERIPAGSYISGDEVVGVLIETGIITRIDVNSDNEINTTDAMLTLRNSLGLDMSGTAWEVSATTGDVNCDENSDSTDAMLLLRYSLGLDMNETNWCD